MTEPPGRPSTLHFKAFRKKIIDKRKIKEVGGREKKPKNAKCQMLVFGGPRPRVSKFFLGRARWLSTQGITVSVAILAWENAR